eukprot:3372784-Rhodomonas_salina.3
MGCDVPGPGAAGPACAQPPARLSLRPVALPHITRAPGCRRAERTFQELCVINDADANHADGDDDDDDDDDTPPSRSETQFQPGRMQRQHRSGWAA